MTVAEQTEQVASALADVAITDQGPQEAVGSPTAVGTEQEPAGEQETRGREQTRTHAQEQTPGTGQGSAAESSGTSEEDGARSPEQDQSQEEFPSKSHSPNSSALQLDQLANTNLLTVRIKWVDNQLLDYKTTQLVNKLSELSHARKGFVVNPSVIENYEYLSDSSRLAVLGENQDVYMHESGTKEFADFHSDESSAGGSWLYDYVLQAQFKHWADLEVVRDSVVAALGESTIASKWSVSDNAHALTHPGNLYVRGIPKDLTIDDLVPVFAKFGPVLSMKIICDSNTGDSLGYGFLSYPLGSQASRCIKELNGNLMNGSPLFINYHVERKERERIHWDHIKEDNDDERFKGVFIGNLPIEDVQGKLITPEDVIAEFQKRLGDGGETSQIVSYYLPKRNSQSDIEYKDDDDKTDDIETCVSKHEESPLKGYGFIKFASHTQALGAIEKFNDMEWLGNKLIVNKAVQSKPQSHYHHHHHHHHQNHNEYRGRRHSERSPSSRQKSMTNISFYAPFSGSQAGFGFYGNPPNARYPAPSDLGPHDIAADSSPNSSPSPHQGYIPPPQLSHRYGAPPSLSSTPESSTAPSSRNDSFFQMQSQGGMMPPSPFMLPIPTKDQQESNLYVKHLPLSWKDEDFFQFYENFGEIISAKIITVGGSKNDGSSDNTFAKQSEPALGSSKGYGFVCFKNPLDASRAMLITDRYQVDENHTLYVSFAQKRAKSISNGDTVMVSTNNSRPSSRKNYYYNNARQDFLGKYNPKFLNAMFNQQNGGRSYPRPRGSWPAPMPMPVAPPHMVPMMPPVVLPSPISPEAIVPGGDIEQDSIAEAPVQIKQGSTTKS